MELALRRCCSAPRVVLMTNRFNFRDFPPNFGDRFPDGTYTVGRGADPRLPSEAATADQIGSFRERAAKPKRAKKPLRPAAE